MIALACFSVKARPFDDVVFCSVPYISLAKRRKHDGRVRETGLLPVTSTAACQISGSTSDNNADVAVRKARNNEFAADGQIWTRRHHLAAADRTANSTRFLTSLIHNNEPSAMSVSAVGREAGAGVGYST